MYQASDRDIWESQERNMGRTVVADKDEDVAGAGRYIIGFILSGIVGLVIQYCLRKKGWTATWINAAIGVILIFLFWFFPFL